MKTSLDHLPDDKREALGAMVEAVRVVPTVGVIILFGSHARGTWVIDRETGYVSDYDLLVVVDDPAAEKSKAPWPEVEKEVDRIAGSAVAQILLMDVRELNHEIRRGQFFWTEIVSEGIVLYDAKKFTIARIKAATPSERRELVQEYFDHWFETAGQFYIQHQDATARGWNPLAAFNLHQATERYLATALLVYTGTKPHLHDLAKLGAMAAPLHSALAEPFPMATDADQRLFELLRTAYIDARYKKSYRITAEELTMLGERVKDLAGRVENACRERIAAMG
ncbi:MAG: HEPN domain-containing protein [Myxococcales bacterium]|nr:HEPN domain-containing protein [Myxococcales bacterium]